MGLSLGAEPVKRDVADSNEAWVSNEGEVAGEEVGSAETSRVDVGTAAFTVANFESASGVGSLGVDEVRFSVELEGANSTGVGDDGDETSAAAVDDLG